MIQAYNEIYSILVNMDAFAIDWFRGKGHGPQFHTDQWKVPPGFDGQTQSFFAYEKSVKEWLDITPQDVAKRGPALRLRLSGLAECYRDLLDVERLKGDDGVQYFLDTLRPHFTNPPSMYS